MKKVTVIIPVYNVENYLEKCLKSVVSQTYKNLEIILIDDGSTDSSGIICDEWKNKDNRITVLHKINGGLSDARNAGLEIATGDYIGFVDSDDYIESDMFELLVNNIEQYNADVSCCRYANVYEDGRRELIGNDHNIYVYENIDGLKEYLYGKVIDPFVCNKLYRAYYINNNQDKAYSIRFIKGILGEDNPFNCEIFKHTQRVVVAGESKYNYLQKRPGAITNSSISQKKIDSVLWWDTIRNECHNNYPELEKYALRRQVLFYIGLYNMILNNNEYLSTKSTIINFLKINKHSILKNNICEKIIKISTLLLINTPTIYSIIMKLYKKLVGNASIINKK